MKIDPQGTGFLPLTPKEQRESMLKDWEDPNYEHYDPEHASREREGDKTYNPKYPTDLSDPNWRKNLPNYTTFLRKSIPCINWFDNSPFRYLIPEKQAKIKKIVLPNEPKKTPWDNTQPWEKPRTPTKDPYMPYPNPTGKHPWEGLNK
jgi:hypothetical protein